MRFMMLVKASPESEAGIMPGEEILAAMGAFNEEMAEAGVMLDGEGLHPSSKGARVHYDGNDRTVTDGPFAETKELVAGFWMIRAESMEEAVAWARRAPFREGEVEIRPVFETEDFGEELTPELRAQEERIRERVESRSK